MNTREKLERCTRDSFKRMKESRIKKGLLEAGKCNDCNILVERERLIAPWWRKSKGKICPTCYDRLEQSRYKQ